MARTIAGTLNVPDTGPLANAEIYFVAKRNEATKILQGVTSVITTDSGGNYSQSVEDGYYAISIRYDNGSSGQIHRYPLGNVFIEAGSAITINALLAVSGSVADPTDAALQQLLADAQQARDEAVAAAASVEVMESLTDTTLGRLMPFGAFGVGRGIPFNGDIDTLYESSAEYNLFESASSASGNVTVSLGDSLKVIRWNDNAGVQFLLKRNPVRIYERNRDAGTWGPFRLSYNQGNILGTVSQSGGIPTGAIIERGSNANGEYVKFADGTMICTKSNVIGDTAQSGTIANLRHQWTFPAAFYNGAVLCSATHRTMAGMPGSLRGGGWESGALTSGSVAVIYWGPAGAVFDQSHSFNANLLAIGRWY